MADTRYWSKEITTSFLEMYKSHPCLWKIKCKDYTNRSLKNAAYDELVDFCKLITPEANRDYVVKKIQSFRGSFRKELKKIEESKRSGEIHTPTLWYFDLLLFTIDQELPAEETDPLGEGTSQVGSIVEGDEDDGVEGNNGEILRAFSSEHHSTPRQFQTSSPTPNKRKRTPKQNKSQTDLINYCKNELEESDSIDEFDAAAILWAKKMKRMNPTQAIYADMLINRIVNQGLLNQLSNTTVITDQPHPFSPPSPHSSISSNSNFAQQGQISQLEPSAGLISYYEKAGNDKS